MEQFDILRNWIEEKEGSEKALVSFYSNNCNSFFTDSLSFFHIPDNYYLCFTLQERLSPMVEQFSNYDLELFVDLVFFLKDECDRHDELTSTLFYAAIGQWIEKDKHQREQQMIDLAQKKPEQIYSIASYLVPKVFPIKSYFQFWINGLSSSNENVCLSSFSVFIRTPITDYGTVKDECLNSVSVLLTDSSYEAFTHVLSFLVVLHLGDLETLDMLPSSFAGFFKKNPELTINSVAEFVLYLQEDEMIPVVLLNICRLCLQDDLDVDKFQPFRVERMLERIWKECKSEVEKSSFIFGLASSLSSQLLKQMYEKKIQFNLFWNKVNKDGFFAVALTYFLMRDDFDSVLYISIVIKEITNNHLNLCLSHQIIASLPETESVIQLLDLIFGRVLYLLWFFPGLVLSFFLNYLDLCDELLIEKLMRNLQSVIVFNRPKTTIDCINKIFQDNQLSLTENKFLSELMDFAEGYQKDQSVGFSLNELKPGRLDMVRISEIQKEENLRMSKAISEKSVLWNYCKHFCVLHANKTATLYSSDINEKKAQTILSQVQSMGLCEYSSEVAMMASCTPISFENVLYKLREGLI